MMEYLAAGFILVMTLTVLMLWGRVTALRKEIEERKREVGRLRSELRGLQIAHEVTLKTYTDLRDGMLKRKIHSEPLS